LTRRVQTIITAPLEGWWRLHRRCCSGPWLAAVDLDVRRLPDKIIYPLLGWRALVVITMFLITGDLSLAWRAVGGGLIAFIGFELLHLLSRGALRFGDVKLAALIGLDASMISWAARGGRS
jgi:leader peptidase (prepilin peptidase)/N-methyltransferase